MNSVAYESIRSDLTTGDIILWSGLGTFSRLIKLMTHSRWSHVAMVIKSEDLDDVFIWEADLTGVSLGNFDNNFPKPSLSLLSNFMSGGVFSRREMVAVRRLEVQRTPEMLAKLGDFRKNMVGKPYEQNKIELLKGMLGELWPTGATDTDYSAFFCSELIAATYKAMGLLPAEIPADRYAPKDFSVDGSGLGLLLGAKLGDELLVKE